jgi:hypothetical protein
LLQLAIPFWHTHALLTQSIPAPQTLPQVPQFRASWVTSVQLLPQRVSVLSWQTQVLPVHCVPGPQIL